MLSVKTSPPGLRMVLTIIALLGVALGVGLYMPIPDSRGNLELSSVKVGPFNWKGVPISQAVDEMNAQISKDPRCYSRISLASDLNTQSLGKISLILDPLPADECARYVAELSGLRLYFVPEGIIIDQMHQDHRPWQQRYRDWIRHTLLQRWYGRLNNG